MEGSQYLMWMKRKQILTSSPQLQAPSVVGSGGCNNNSSTNYSSWEERAFAEDAARVLCTGSMWPPRSYSCTFCKREFRSAQALGGHMNIHRRDRARLKQNLISPHHESLSLHHHHHKNNDFKSSLVNHFPPEIEKLCCLSPCSVPATTITTSARLSVPSSIILEQKIGCPTSEPEGLVNAKEDNFIHVETNLSVGLTSTMFGQKSPSFPCGDRGIISCKRLKSTNNISSSLPIFLKPCSNDRGLMMQPAEIVLGLNHHGMEDLDLELRLGKQQKVK